MDGKYFQHIESFMRLIILFPGELENPVQLITFDASTRNDLTRIIEIQVHEISERFLIPFYSFRCTILIR
jgi:hypothetical protein